MRVNYDPVADTIYIRLLKGIKSTKTIEVEEGLNVDYAGKKLIGIEIVDASKKFPKKSLDEVTLSVPTNAQINAAI